MALDLGTAWIQISPSMKGVRAAVEKEFNGVNVTGLTSGISGAFSTVAKVGGAAIATVGAAVTGLALKGGIQRALSIEGAQAKLTGLGHDAASVSEIMKSALDSVKGTAFGLGDAATVAASLSAAGVQSGEYMTSVLKTVADTAQISGRSLTDIGTIFGSVAARGKLQGDDMLQLMSSGVPVLQFLSDQLGVTSADVSKMVSAGQIDFATFASAMQAGLGGAALSAGDTFSGAMANVQAALSRIGAAGATPALEGIRVVGVALIPVIDALAVKLQPLFDAFGERVTADAERAAGALGSLATALSGSGQIDTAGLTSVLPGLVPVFGAVVAGIAPLLKGIPILGPGFAGLAGPVGLVVGVFGAMVAASAPLREALGGLVQTLGGTFQQILPVVTQALQLFGGVLGQLGTALAPIVTLLGTVFSAAIQAVLPIISQLASIVAVTLRSALEGLTPLIQFLATVLGSVVSQVLGALSGAIQALMPTLMQLVQGLLPVVLGIITQLVPVVLQVVLAVMPLIGQILPIVVQLIQRLVPMAVQIVQMILPVILQLITMLVPLFVQIVTAVMPLVAQILPLMIGLVMSLLPIIIQVVQAVLPPLISVVQALIPVIMIVIGVIVQIIQTVLPPLIDIIQNVIVPIIEFLAPLVAGIIGAILTVIANLVTWITTVAWPGIQQALNWIGGAFDTMRDGIGTAINFVRDNIIQPLVDWFNSTIVPAFNSIKDGIVGAFEAVKEGISNAWNAIKELAAEPVRFVVNTVVAGLVETYNGVAEKFGAATATVPHVAFAEGGLTRDAQIGSRPILWGEAGPEAYIPLSPAKRGRSVNIWARTGQILGVLPMEDGGILGNIASAVTGFLSDPAGFLLGKISGLMDAMSDNAFVQILKGIPGNIADMIAAWFKDHIASMFTVPGGGPVSGAFDDWWTAAVAINPAMAPFKAIAATVAQYESGFNPTVVNNWDSNAAAGTPSAGLMQFIQPTFAAYQWPGFSNWLGPVDQLLAWWNYVNARYGGPMNIPGIVGLASGTGYVGYAKGTANARRGLAWVGENGPELVNFSGGERVWDADESVGLGRSTTIVFSPTYKAEDRSVRRDLEDLMAEMKLRQVHV